jgi:RecA DNA recombination protein
MAAPARRLTTQFQLLDLRPSRSKPTLLPPLPPVEIEQREAVRNLRAALDPAIARKVTSATELIRALEKTRREDFLPTTIDAIDSLLGGGLRRGKVVELVSRRASGRFSILMSTLAAATSIGEAAALIDVSDHFDPQLAEAAGVDLRRLLWVRPTTMKQAVMAAEMITATGFQLVIIDAGLHPVRGRRVPDAVWVRLARAAEAQGTAMLISSPYPFTGTVSEAVVRGEKTRVKWLGQGKSPRLLAGVTTDFRLEKHRHLKPGAPATCDLRPATAT